MFLPKAPGGAPHIDRRADLREAVRRLGGRALARRTEQGRALLRQLGALESIHGRQRYARGRSGHDDLMAELGHARPNSAAGQLLVERLEREGNPAAHVVREHLRGGPPDARIEAAAEGKQRPNGWHFILEQPQQGHRAVHAVWVRKLPVGEHHVSFTARLPERRAAALAASMTAFGKLHVAGQPAPQPHRMPAEATAHA